MSVELNEPENRKLLEVHLTGKLVIDTTRRFCLRWSGWSNSTASS